VDGPILDREEALGHAHALRQLVQDVLDRELAGDERVEPELESGTGVRRRA